VNRTQDPRYRIAFAIPALDKGGPDKVVFDLVRALDRTRFRPYLVVSKPQGYYLSRLGEDVEVVQLKPENGRRGRYPVFGLARAVRRIRPHVVLATLRMGITAELGKAMFPASTAVITRPANMFSVNSEELVEQAPVKHRISRWIVRRASRLADVIVCQSEAMRVDLQQALDRPPRMVVIGNPIDAEWVRAQADVDPVELKGGPRLVSVGRLAPQKGYDVLLRALALVRTRVPEAHLTLVGEGPERPCLERLAASLGLAEAVTFAGFQENPYPFMRAADLVISSSRYEGFANVILEALACRTPVVATDCPGATREVLQEGLTGWIAESSTPGSLAAAVCRGLENRLERRMMDALCERFSLPRIVAAYEDLFASVARQEVRPC
jgi:glycosyltransferase involved in cell wall biosynthesis